MKRLLSLACLIVATTVCHADEFIYADNASSGAPYIFKIDLTTGGNIVNTYSGLSGSNGRGAVTVGNTLYYTSAGTPNIFAYNLSTNTNLGSVFAVGGASALSTIAYDGTNIYIGDYSGTNAVYKYSLTGTLLATLHLQNCTGNCDGLEYFIQGGVGQLIENRSDEGRIYDVYNLDGSLKTAAFLTSPANISTGIAYDGTNFFTSNADSPGLDEFTSTGSFLKTITVTGEPAQFPFLVEDLSVDYNLVLPPPPTGASPEPGSIVLLGTGALGMIGAIRRKLFV